MPASEKLNIDTPEQVALEFSLATVGSRFLALGIDTLIQAATGAVLLVLAALGTWASRGVAPGAGPWLLGGLVLGGFVTYYGYFAVFEAMWQGQTPGKRIVGLRVIHASGRPLSTVEAILRNIVRIVDQMPGIYAIGIVSVFLTARSQRLGDLAAGTVVVHERGVEGGLEAIRAASAPVGGLRRYGAGRLTAEEVAVIDLYFSRRDQLDGHARVRAVRQIAARIRDRLAITERTDDDEQLLADVAAEYREMSRFR